MVMSHITCSTLPPPTAKPLTEAITAFRSVAGIERAHHRADLAEHRALLGDGDVAHHLQHVAAADRKAVDRGDHRLQICSRHRTSPSSGRPGGTPRSPWRW